MSMVEIDIPSAEFAGGNVVFVVTVDGKERTVEVSLKALLGSAATAADFQREPAEMLAQNLPAIKPVIEQIFRDGPGGPIVHTIK